jgi:glycosyltransferase involved in cell wall biosynthesis
MNILYLIDTTGPGGAETVFSNLIAGVRDCADHPVAVLKGPGWLYDNLAAAGGTPLLVPQGGSFDFRYLARLRRLIRSYDIRLVHAHLLTAAVYGSVAASSCGVPTVATFHGTVDTGRGGNINLRLKLAILKRLATRLVFVSNNLKHFFTELAGFDDARTATIYNGVDTERFRPSPNESLRRELGIAAGDILIGTVGNIRAPKDYPTFLRVAALLHERSARYHFVIAGHGSGTLYEELIALRKSLGLEGTMHFLGLRADTAVILNNLDAFLLTSTTEGFSIATIEAMACGVPVVATRSGGPEEIITDGADGILTTVGAASQMADALERLVDDAALREALTGKALDTVRSRFSEAAMIAAYRALYAQIANSG